MKKAVLLILAALSFLFLGNLAYAQASTVNIHLFWQLGCPHCEEEIKYLDKYKKANLNVQVFRYEISKSPKNAQLLQQAAQILDFKVTGIPVTIIGNGHFEGFGTPETHGQIVESLVAKAIEEGYPDAVKTLTTAAKPEEGKEPPIDNPSIPDKVNVPFLKEISIKDLSLPALTFVLALADGFNPCAMWVLLFLISLLLGMENRKKMWLMGGTFILVSGAVYFMFLSAWLNLFLVLGFISWIRILIGLVALYAAYHNVKEYIKNKDGTCEVVGGNEKRKKTFEKMRKYVTEKNLLLALGGIALLAVAVNMVELVCSAGLPAIFTKILSLSSLPTWKYYAYLLGYVLVFMIDDMVVFVIAMVTLKTVGLTGKYSRFSHLIGGILMAIIGVLMILKPEVLMFG
ncbi:MAG: hypothetical protein WC243_01955 [Patescibacteria group bacterium]|jgi:hypothetical protein